MSIIDDKTPIIFDQVDKIGSDFQKMFKTEFSSMKISAKPSVSVNFCKFHFFSRGEGGVERFPLWTGIGLKHSLPSIF